jgi:hypothetical protein
VVRDAARADLAEGGGGSSSGAIWAEAKAQNERGDMGTGVRVEGRRRVAAGEGRRHGCRDGHEINRAHSLSTARDEDKRHLLTVRFRHDSCSSFPYFFVMLIFSFACDPELTFR